MSVHLGKDARWESSFLAFMYRQFFYRPKPITADLSGQTAIITGANVGLGFEAGRQLLGLGLSRLILACRSQVKGDAAAATLRKEHPSAKIEVWLLDMSSYASIKEFVKRCAGDELQRLDIAILNAGVQNTELIKSEQTGYETTFQVNYVSTALLSILLLPVLWEKRASGRPARLSIIGSDTQYWARVDPAGGPILPRIAAPAKFESMNQYATTKLLLMGFVMKLAESIDPEVVIVNVVNPGLTASTDISKGTPPSLAFRTFLMLTGRSLEWGADTYVEGVVVKGKESHGSFVSDWTIKPFPTIYYTEEGVEMKDRLWEETMEELNFVGASGIVSKLANAKL
ncbi:short-chain dehydrogenase reductase family [Diaporthe amygdali]|uniref:short-chain dehydrogenase reductase family n=1 Tax=Phomopsis amygdali TaxID=1214568 RepID=UPI0022FE45EE|nr:short-chain dehydrogenase reductase family [Diaporthe amygdali]KAJ0116605.1 short-chain dehydrogenase reductase family [Diaporthe amygdali]